MKALNFLPYLVPPILSGEKTSTWRLFDDKDLKVGDEIAFINKENGEEFAQAILTSVVEKKLEEIDDSDMEGHAKYESKEAMLKHFQDLYGNQVTLETPVKIVSFSLVQ